MKRSSRPRPAWFTGARATLAAVPLLAMGILANAGPTAAAAAPVTIHVLSTRADLVSGGDALVSITLPAGTNASGVAVTLNGEDISSEFAVRPNSLFEGLVTGLQLGSNSLVATLPSGSGAKLAITNHPQSGPVFSGPEVQPWTCNTGATDVGCDMPATYAYYYMPAGTSSAGSSAFQSYNPSEPPPPEAIATTTTDNGQTVPFIVREETGSIDRGQYQIAVLYQPGQPWDPWAPQPRWDGKLEIPGGSSCGTGHSEATSPSVLDANALGLGFAVASNALANNGNNCNLVTQAESVEMTKEYFVDHYGPITYTIATGCSGGSIFQQQTNNAYPGLYQGEVVNCSFPDSWSTSMEPVDCQLLLSYWSSAEAASQGWTPAQDAAVDGQQSLSPCESWVNVYGYNKLGDPSGDGSNVGPACGVPSNEVYNASDNPGGVRCDLQDYMINEFGSRPKSVWTAPEKEIHHGFANDPYDNTGVQYGLQPLMDGTITPAQFAGLNASVGGLTIDDQPQVARSAADPGALQVLYRSGAFNEYNNMVGVPIIDIRGHDTAEIHEDFQSYAARARLDQFTGGHANQVIWTGPIPLVGDTSFDNSAFDTMNQWLANIQADKSSASLPTKVAGDKPAGTVDECFTGTGQVITNQQVCQTLYPVFADPRIAAGEPLSNDVEKCQLKPLEQSDYYPIQFTDAEWAQLEQAFPTGVCNYSVKGVGQAGAVPWLSYANGPGGTPVGAPPKSVAFSS
ncbi:MAG: hypothetical protein JWM19_7546 [Actinomycetia bacterium]|nr:hypothetical protein [Actinomycetes bacterium]